MCAPWVPAEGAAGRTGYWYRAATPSQRDVAYRHRSATRFEINLLIRRRLHRLNQGLARSAPCQPPALLGSDHHNLISPMHSYVLRAFAAAVADEFSEPGLGVRQQPVAGARFARVGH